MPSPRWKSYWLLGALFFGLSLTACRHTNQASYGLQSDNLAYIPARIAVLPCRLWPQTAGYPGMSLSNVDRDRLLDICESFDSFIIEGFQGQPYMRGISAGVVKQLLEREGQLDILTEIDEHWRRQTGECAKCNRAIDYYKQVLSARQPWRIWLTGFSRTAYNSDAILFPLLTYVHEGRLDDRGITISFRKIGGLLLLIDTNTGELIWAGGREAEARRQLPRREAGPDEPPLPEWSEVYERLFTIELWQEFPGRQNF